MFWMTSAVAATLSVGPAQPYTTLSAALSAAVSGDTIEIEAGTYDADVLVQNKDLTLIGIGNPVLVSNTAGLRFRGGNAVVVQGVTFDGTQRSTNCLATEFATLTQSEPDPEVRDTTFRRCATGLTTNAIGSTVVVDSHFVDNALGIHDTYGIGVRIRRVEFRDNAVPFDLGVADLVLAESDFVGNTRAARFDVGGFDNYIVGNRFCGNGGGTLSVVDTDPRPGDNLLIGENLFQENTGTTAGALRLSGNATPYQVQLGAAPVRTVVMRNTFVGNTTTNLASHVYASGWVRPIFESNVFVAGSQGRAAIVEDAGIQRQVTGVYNLFWDNAPTDLSGVTKQEIGWIGADPMWTDVTLDGNCDNDDFRPLPGSPLPDGGNPARPQLDGTPPDLGYSLY